MGRNTGIVRGKWGGRYGSLGTWKISHKNVVLYFMKKKILPFV